MFMGMLMTSHTLRMVKSYKKPLTLGAILVKTRNDITIYMHNITLVLPKQKLGD